MASEPSTLRLRVLQAQMLAPAVRALRLCAVSGPTPLPGFSAGAHLQVKVDLAPGLADWRRYSLVNLDPAPGAAAAPTAYSLAIRREADGRGGSRYLHDHVQVGDELLVQWPRNDFELVAGAGRAVLIAGGIGVTPLASMAATCRSEGRQVRLHYAGRSRAAMALLPELAALLGDDLIVHADDEAAAALDILAILKACTSTDTVYVCGPQPMLDAVLAHTRALGWPSDRLQFELFGAPQAEQGNTGFEVQLARSGQTLTVPPDRTLLSVLNDAGCDLLFDCERGECGVCAVEVIDGDIDHRDHVLTDAERANGRVMHACVSRCRGARLVLDL